MLYITVLGTPLKQYKSDFAVIVFVAKFSIWGYVYIILTSNKFKAINLVPAIIYGTDLFNLYMYEPERTANV